MEDELRKEEDVGLLLERAGPREEPAEDARLRVRAATYWAWQALPERNRARAAPLAAVAAAAVVVVAVFVGQRSLAPRSDVPHMAEILHATGAYAVGEERGSTKVLPPGATVTTSASGRLVIRLADGAVLRLDTSSSVIMQDRNAVTLHRGRVFVDSRAVGVQGGSARANRGGSPVVTARGGVRVTTVGTQFAVSVEDTRVSVAVREGTVRMTMGGESATASARSGVGEVVVVENLAEVSRQPLGARDAHWGWIHQAQPDFSLESASVGEFLHWAARETALVLIFESEAVRQHAATVRLHGPGIAAADLERLDILEIVETAPSFRAVITDDGRLVVGFERG